MFCARIMSDDFVNVLYSRCFVLVGGDAGTIGDGQQWWVDDGELDGVS